LFLFTGLVLASPLIADTISRSLASATWGAQYSNNFRQAVADVIVPLIQQAAGGIVLTGIVACLIALALLVWSWSVPAAKSQHRKMVQVPVRSTSD
jgi:hypothetical protein